ILPTGKILALFSSTHWYICRKVSACFVLLLVLPSGLFLLRPRVRSLMKEVGGCSSRWLSQEHPSETRSLAVVRERWHLARLILWSPRKLGQSISSFSLHCLRS